MKESFDALRGKNGTIRLFVPPLKGGDILSPSHFIVPTEHGLIAIYEVIEFYLLTHTNLASE